jgi:hypothetical protein
MFRSCYLNGHTNSLVQRSGGYYLREYPNRQETHFQMSSSHWPYYVFDQTKERTRPQVDTDITAMPLSVDCYLIGELVFPE